MARARRALPRPGEGLPQGGQGAGARARAEAPPRPQATAARDREADRKARAASQIAGMSNGQRIRWPFALRVRRAYLPPKRTPAVKGMNEVFAAPNDFETST